MFVYDGGNDTITDYDLLNEEVNLDALNLTEQQINDVVSQAENNLNGNAVLNFGNGNTITFEGLTAQDLENNSSANDDDVINDDNNGNLIETGIGNDSVLGNGGNDTLRGEGDNDTLRGGAGEDQLEGGSGDDLLDASAGDVQTEGQGDLVLPGLGRDEVIGNAALYAAGDGITLSYADVSGIGGVVITSGPNGSGSVTGAGGVLTDVDDTFSFVEFFAGSQGGDTITGSDDIRFEGFAGLGGADVINGGNGFDLLVYSFEVDFFGGVYRSDGQGGVLGIDANLATGQVIDTQGNTDSVSGIEEILGTDERDAMSAAGAIQGATFVGLLGDDTLIGGDFSDILRGGGGDDSIVTGQNDGIDVVIAGDGNDAVDVSGLTDGYVEFQHFDLDEISNDNTSISVVIDATLGANSTGMISKNGGSQGTTTIEGIEKPLVDSNPATSGVGLVGTRGADSFDVTVNNAVFLSVQGGAGDDSYTFAGSGNFVRLDFNSVGAGRVRANLGAATQILDDGFGNDEAITGIESVKEYRFTMTDVTVLGDSVLGSAADEAFILMAGNDTLDGGGGTDLVRYDRGGVGAVTINLTSGLGTGVWNGVNFVHNLSGVENISGSRTDGDGLTGDAFANLIDGKGGNDVLEGRDGEDTLVGGDGADTIRGGSGTDSILGGAGEDRIEGGADSDWMDGGDNNDELFGGGVGNDTMFGGRGSDFIFGEVGNDIMHGEDGFDRMNGGSGNDSMTGGGGNDFMEGNLGFDTLEGDGGNDTLYGGPSGNDVLKGGDDNDLLFGEAGRDLLFGEAGDDDLRGGTGNDDLIGGAGKDTLDGGQGNDKLFGGTEDDELKGFQGSDLLFGEGGNDVMEGGDGFDLLNGGAGNDLIRGGNGNDRLEGNLGEDTLEGGNANDQLFGGNGVFSDTLRGDAGNDTLNGERGNDILDGGADSDTFVFSGQFGADTITDFDAFDSNEKINLNGAIGIDDYADLLANHMTDDGTDTTIDDLFGNTIVIENALVVDLGIDDFVTFT